MDALGFHGDAFLEELLSQIPVDVAALSHRVVSNQHHVQLSTLWHSIERRVSSNESEVFPNVLEAIHLGFEHSSAIRQFLHSVSLAESVLLEGPVELVDLVEEFLLDFHELGLGLPPHHLGEVVLDFRDFFFGGGLGDEILVTILIRVTRGEGEFALLSACLAVGGVGLGFGTEGHLF